MIEEVTFSADAPEGIEGRKGRPATLLAVADIPPLPREGALEALDGKPVFFDNCLHLGDLGAQVLLESNAACRYVLSASSFREGGGEAAMGPNMQSASWVP